MHTEWYIKAAAKKDPAAKPANRPEPRQDANDEERECPASDATCATKKKRTNKQPAKKVEEL